MLRVLLRSTGCRVKWPKTTSPDRVNIYDIIIIIIMIIVIIIIIIIIIIAFKGAIRDF